MTANELHEKRHELIAEYVAETHMDASAIDDLLKDMALLDAQIRIPRPPYYAFVERHEAQWKLFLASQGETESAILHQLAVIDVLMTGLVEYADMLEGKNPS